MSRGVVKATIDVDTVGEPSDYISLPIVKDEIAIGVITNCVEEGKKYKLTVLLWQDVGLETINGKPSAVVFNY